MVVALILIFSACSLALLYSAYCQYTCQKLQLHDYGIYTNFMWNSAHGQWFRLLVDSTYLKTHLSFTLLLLAPLFRIWDHPFLLTLLQWSIGVSGALLLGWTARRHGLSVILSLSMATLHLGYAYTQWVLLCEFHGVCLYLLLLPWLFHTLSLARRWVWLPLILLLGLREDAAFVILPFFLYFAIRDRWKAGYIYFGIVLLYGVLAIRFLFPWLSGMSITERRSSLISTSEMIQSFDSAGVIRRLKALAWLLLPVVPLIPRRAWHASGAFCLTSTLILMASPSEYHHGLERHYAAAPFTSVVLGMIATLAWLPAESRIRRWAGPWGLTAALASYLACGPLLGGGQTRKHFNRIDERGLESAWVASTFIPREGILLCDKKLAGFCANRADLLTYVEYNPDRHNVAVYLLGLEHLKDKEDRAFELIQGGRHRVEFYDGRNIILKPGPPSELNDRVLADLPGTRPEIVFAFTQLDDGRNVFARGCGPARYWQGRSRPSGPLTKNKPIPLKKGLYIATFRLRARKPENGSGSWGRIALHTDDQREPFLTVPVDPIETEESHFRYQEVPFEMEQDGLLHVSVTGEDAPLWLDRVQIQTQPEEESSSQPMIKTASR